MTLEQFNNLPVDMQGLINTSYYDDYLSDCNENSKEAVFFQDFIKEIEYRSDSGLSYFDEKFAKYNPHDIDEEEEATDTTLNFYKCPECNHKWQDLWSCGCDDDCPKCGCRHISPYKSEPVNQE